ncbi:MAG: hypothetical protein A2516_08440 [Alphaproteobacteria bacterium RIFOXYD12_FULL_60_8]|nr:MAG: hypothetical protein A2516_08440 [Alphaproteobacteria bacterium RIFOXYD12_FULL_60_8]
MMPLRGWYRLGDWIKTFRPDGKGHIKIIADAMDPVEDIEFTDICCDLCNSDAGAPQSDGAEVLIYYDGVDSLCRACGLRAEAEHLDEIRRTLKRRGWADFHVANLKPEHLRAIAHEQAVDEVVGASPADVARSLSWDCVEAILWASRLLEEVNEHKLSKLLFDAVEQKGDSARETDQ